MRCARLAAGLLNTLSNGWGGIGALTMKLCDQGPQMMPSLARTQIVSVPGPL